MDEAINFLNEQQQRIDSLEKELLLCTEELLPTDSTDDSHDDELPPQGNKEHDTHHDNHSRIDIQRKLTTPELVLNLQSVHHHQEEQIRQIQQLLRGYNQSIRATTAAATTNGVSHTTNPPKSTEVWRTHRKRRYRSSLPKLHAVPETEEEGSGRGTPVSHSVFEQSGTTKRSTKLVLPQSTTTVDDMEESGDDSEDDHSCETGPTWVAPRPDDDDSAAYCPTIVRRDIRGATLITPSSISHAVASPLGRSFHIETDSLSPDRTNLTIDVSALNETMECFNLNENKHSDPLSPPSGIQGGCGQNISILDRYRLEPDEESPHGFRVVPNFSFDDQRQNSPRRKKADGLRVLADVRPNHGDYPDDEMGSLKVPATKTSCSTAEEDENAPMNLLGHEMDRTVPASPLWDPHDLVHRNRSPATAPTKIYGINSSTTIRSGGRCPNSNPPSMSVPMPSKYDSHDRIRRILPITGPEYDCAPRIIKMKVSLTELQQALDRLRHAQDGFSQYECMQFLPFPERKTKAILMSLCHFKRLRMRRENGDVVFDFAMY